MKRVTTIGKRPATATREAGILLRNAGLTYAAIGKLWSVSRARVFQILHPKLKKQGA
ncbi:MAG: hypothetical protein Q7R34_00845 [Dehalococcoidia bacterium]|nr:hypothetical protein [Dehalococcoidia bacterium]